MIEAIKGRSRALDMRLPFRYFWKYKDAAGACQIIPDDMAYQEPSRCSDECAETQSTRPPFMKHDVHLLEETMKFEHGNQCLKIQNCKSCRENLLNGVKLLSYGPKFSFKCDSCEKFASRLLQKDGSSTNLV